MNYSQRKHLERLLADVPERFDPFAIAPRSLFGMKVVESPDRPRYTLPEEIVPGVPWPPGFRDEINRWSVSFLGTTNVMPRGITYVLGDTIVMRPNDVVNLLNCI